MDATLGSTGFMSTILNHLLLQGFEVVIRFIAFTRRCQTYLTTERLILFAILTFSSHIGKADIGTQFLQGRMHRESIDLLSNIFVDKKKFRALLDSAEVFSPCTKGHRRGSLLRYRQQ